MRRASPAGEPPREHSPHKRPGFVANTVEGYVLAAAIAPAAAGRTINFGKACPNCRTPPYRLTPPEPDLPHPAVGR